VQASSLVESGQRSTSSESRVEHSLDKFNRLQRVVAQNIQKKQGRSLTAPRSASSMSGREHSLSKSQAEVGEHESNFIKSGCTAQRTVHYGTLTASIAHTLSLTSLYFTNAPLFIRSSRPCCRRSCGPAACPCRRRNRPASPSWRRLRLGCACCVTGSSCRTGGQQPTLAG